MNAPVPQSHTKTRKTGRLVGYIILLNSFILLIFNYNDGIKSITQTIDSWRKPSLNLTFTPNLDVKANDYVELNYSAPDYGYLSLWNWNAKGRIKLMQPVFNLNSSNKTGHYTLRPTEPGMEHAIMVWTNTSAEHITGDYFDSDAEFESAVKVKGKAIHRIKQSIQIY